MVDRIKRLGLAPVYSDLQDLHPFADRLARLGEIEIEIKLIQMDYVVFKQLQKSREEIIRSQKFYTIIFCKVLEYIYQFIYDYFLFMLIISRKGSVH